MRFFGKEIVSNHSNVTFVISHRVEKYNFPNFKFLNDKKKRIFDHETDWVQKQLRFISPPLNSISQVLLEECN